MTVKKTILVVDDSESIREVMVFTLENEGYEVILSNDGANAIKLFDGRRIDLLITDLYMPQMNGVELIKLVKKQGNYVHMPILFLTTESQHEKKMEAKDAGATGWVIKPFVPAKLLAAIKKVIR